MTPAVKVANKAKINYSLHEYKHDSRSQSYGEEAAEVLRLSTAEVFKTLLVAMNGQDRQLAVAVVPVEHQLNLKAVAKALGIKKVAMADPQHAQNITGYLLGGISPLGQKKCLPTILNETVKDFDLIYVSAGKRGLEISLSPDDLIKLTNAKLAKITAY